MIQPVGGRRIHQTDTTGAAVRKTLVSHFRVCIDRDGVARGVNQSQRSSGSPGIGVVIEQGLAKWVVDVRTKVRLKVGPKHRDRIRRQHGIDLELVMSPIQQGRQQPAVRLRQEFLEGIRQLIDRQIGGEDHGEGEGGLFLREGPAGRTR